MPHDLLPANQTPKLCFFLEVYNSYSGLEHTSHASQEVVEPINNAQ